MRGGRDVRGEEVAVKKFNMTFKKPVSARERAAKLHAKDGGQAGPLGGQARRRGEGCTPGLPSFCGGFVFL